MIRNGSKGGVALGGGGVRGLAHVPALETIDACGIEPTAVTGTSMGAIIGVLYASGKSGKEIHHIVEEHILTRRDGIKGVYAKKNALLRWLDAFRVAWKGTGLLKADGFLRHLIGQVEATRFEELQIPLRVIATDYHSAQAVVFDSGPLLPALKASMSIPGVFVPVEHEGRILVDGGVSNNLPYDLLPDGCDVSIAVDVTPTREKEESGPPNMIDATLGMFDMLVERITRAMIEDHPPDIYFHLRIVDTRILEFDKAEDVLKQADKAVAELRDKLEAS